MVRKPENSMGAFIMPDMTGFLGVIVENHILSIVFHALYFLMQIINGLGQVLQTLAIWLDIAKLMIHVPLTCSV